MSTQHIVTGAAAKVSIGGAGGNRVAALLRHGDVVPVGVAEEQLKRLEDRGLIKAVEVKDTSPEQSEQDVDIPEGDPSEEWTAKQLDAYAASKGIDLGTGKNKAEKVAAIAAAAAA